MAVDARPAMTSLVVAVCPRCHAAASKRFQHLLRRVNAQLPLVGEYVCDACYRSDPAYKRRAADSAAATGRVRSERTRKLWLDPGYRATNVAAARAAQRELHADPDYLRKLSGSLRACWADPDYRATRAALSASRSYRSKISASLRSLYGSDGRLRQSLLDRVRSAEFRAHMAIIQSSVEYRAMMAESTKLAWCDPAYRDRVTTASRAMFASDGWRNFMATVRANQPRESSLQLRLYEALDRLGVEYYKEGQQTRLGYYVFDCLAVGPATKLLIECNGEYWHSLPGMAARDKAKRTYVSKYHQDHALLTLWECDFYTNDKVVEVLADRLGVAGRAKPEQFDFSDLVVSPCQYSDVRALLDHHHYLGARSGSKHFSCSLRGSTVAVAVFGAPVRQNTKLRDHLELSRFCIHPGYQVHNLASWFLSRCLSDLSSPVVAYADTTVAHDGGMYRATNFTLDHEVPPDYWYVDGDGYVMHKKTLYNRAVRLRLTEAEYALRFGYCKRGGGKKLCYRWRPPR